MMFKRFLLKLMDPFVGHFFRPFYSDTYCLRIADIIEDEIEGTVEIFSLLSLFLTLSPDNSCEDLSQCCFYFPMTLSFFSSLLSILSCQTL